MGFLPDDLTKEKNRKSTPASIHIQPEDDLDHLTTKQPPVTIMVESPKDPPNVDFGVNLTTSSDIQPFSIDASKATNKTTFTFDDVNQPIDVNKPRDTSNIFYAYEEPNEKFDSAQIIEQTIENQMKLEQIQQADQGETSTSQSTKNDSDDRNKNDQNVNATINKDDLSS